MLFARPDGVPREKFHALVKESAGPDGWFQKLCPYTSRPPLFNFEKTNYKLKDDTNGETIKEFEPLKCIAISTKRYALYNEGPTGEPIIRKASAHGLGDVGYPQEYDPAASPATAPEHIAAGIRDGKRQYSDLVQGAGARFFLDFWRIAIREFERGTPENIDWIVGNLKGLDSPQFSQSTLSTKDGGKITRASLTKGRSSFS